jgi:hypothetical protein
MIGTDQENGLAVPISHLRLNIDQWWLLGIISAFTIIDSDVAGTQLCVARNMPGFIYSLMAPHTW